MKTKFHSLQLCFITTLLACFTVPLRTHAAPGAPDTYTQVNLTADEDGVASNTDPELLNPWGLSAGPASVWVNASESGLTQTYFPTGRPYNWNVPILGKPTGIAFNDTRGFVLTNKNRRAPATYLTATKEGTITAWNQPMGRTNALTVADQSGAGASYTGIAIASDTNKVPFIYAANFRLGRIDVYDTNFALIGLFTDPTVPGGYAPFNIRNIRGKLFITFAKQAPNLVDVDPGTGNGYVDVFDTDGTLLRRFASNGPLDAPWGMAIAPRNFGAFSGALLVANHGDGKINAFDLLTGKWLGALKDTSEEEIVIPGLWGLDFDRRESPSNECGFAASRLYFTAGPDGGAHGLLGFLRATRPFGQPRH